MRTLSIKLILSLLLFEIFSWSLSANNSSIIEQDSVFNFQYINSISISEPERALHLLDQAEAEKRIPQYQIDNLRSCVYQNGFGLYRMAVLYSEKAYRSDSIRQHPEELLNLLDLMTDQYNNIGNHETSIRYAIEGAELAKKLKNKGAEANMLLYIGINKRELGLKLEARPYINQAIEIQEQSVEEAVSWYDIDDLLYSYGVKITHALEDSVYQQAIDLLPKYERQMKRLENMPDTPGGVCDMRYASEYAAFACIFLQNGEPKKAEEYYQKYLKTDYSTSIDGEPIRIEYLLSAKRYKEAMRYIQKEMQNCIDQKDTISYTYIHYVLEYKARAETGLNNHKAAAETYRQMLLISDSLNARDKESVSLELATIYETNEKDRTIIKQQSRIRENNIMIISIGGILLLAIGFIAWFVRGLRITLHKNKVMAKQIDNLISCEAELFHTKKRVALLSSLLAAQSGNSDITAQSTDKETDDITLFNQIDEYIKGNKLFLQPEIDREALIKLVHTNKNKFTHLIQDNTHTTFNDYINNLRLEYSISLMRNYPQYTIEAISIESGFKSSRSYYRLFRDKYGMTPFEYKKVTKNEEDK